MRFVALDVATKTGWSLFETDEDKSVLKLIEYGTIIAEKSPLETKYPWGYLISCKEHAMAMYSLIREKKADFVVIEETNKAKARYSQKGLEWRHAFLIDNISSLHPIDVLYISSSEWRKTLGLALSKEDKKNNQKVKKAQTTGLSKKELGVKGKIGKKHISVRYANERWGLQLKQKDNDVADSLCQGEAWFKGALICDGK